MQDNDRDPAKTTDGHELEESISNLLSGARVKFVREPSIGGLRPDFIVYGPQGQTVLLEAKTFLREPDLERVRNQILHYKEATGANAALIVTNSDGLSNSEITPLSTLLYRLDVTLKDSKPSSPSLKSVLKAQRTVFAAMPFSDKYDDIYFVAMTHAAEGIQAACVRVDKEQFSGEIPSKLKLMLQESIAVIADLSEARPNVLYELGFAHALNKPVIHICSSPLEELPFDVRNWSTLSYTLGRTHEFRDRLRARLAAVVGEATL